MARYSLHLGDCFSWMDGRAQDSVHAMVTDPPYYLVGRLRIEAFRDNIRLRSSQREQWRVTVCTLAIASHGWMVARRIPSTLWSRTRPTTWLAVSASRHSVITSVYVRVRGNNGALQFAPWRLLLMDGWSRAGFRPRYGHGPALLLGWPSPHRGIP